MDILAEALRRKTVRDEKDRIEKAETHRRLCEQLAEFKIKNETNFEAVKVALSPLSGTPTKYGPKLTVTANLESKTIHVFDLNHDFHMSIWCESGGFLMTREHQSRNTVRYTDVVKLLNDFTEELSLFV